MVQSVLTSSWTSLIIPVVSLLVSVVAACLAAVSVAQAKIVADRDRREWKQRKWFDLYLKANESFDYLEQFQVRYPSTSAPGWSSDACQEEWNRLMLCMRNTHAQAVVFPKNRVIDALFGATQHFANFEEALSRDRLKAFGSALEGLRIQARLDSELLIP